MVYKELRKRVTITCRGNDGRDINTALTEAMRHVQAGYLLGHAGNDSSAYHFQVDLDVPEGERPA